MMKEIVWKTKVKENIFPRNLTIDNSKVTEKLLIAKNLNDFFVNISLKLAPVISNITKTFHTFLPEINTVLNGTELTKKEFLHAFQSLKNDKSPCFGELHVNVIKSVYNEIKSLLMYVFRNSIDNGSFSERMKIAKVTPIFKAGKKELVTNYRPISILPSLSKILERIIYDRLYS